MAAKFHFFGDLQDILVRRYREGPTVYRFKDHPGIKDAIEAMSLPHTEVDAIIVNGTPVGFNYQLQHHDEVEVYPPHACVPIKDILHLSSQSPTPATFVIDVHLGKLAHRLRLLGFDCLYENDFADDEIIRHSLSEKRIILTKDRGLLKHSRVVYGYLVRNIQVTVQVQEVLTRYRLIDQIQPWTRCMVCNGLLEKVLKSAIESRLKIRTRTYFDEFHRCISCDRLFWPGSHFKEIESWLSDLIALQQESFQPDEALSDTRNPMHCCKHC